MLKNNLKWKRCFILQWDWSIQRKDNRNLIWKNSFPSSILRFLLKLSNRFATHKYHQLCSKKLLRGKIFGESTKTQPVLSTKILSSSLTIHWTSSVSGKINISLPIWMAISTWCRSLVIWLVSNANKGCLKPISSMWRTSTEVESTSHSNLPNKSSLTKLVSMSYLT